MTYSITTFLETGLHRMSDSLTATCLTPIAGLYLWTWLMLITVLVVMPAGLWLTRDQIDCAENPDLCNSLGKEV